MHKIYDPEKIRNKTKQNSPTSLVLLETEKKEVLTSLVFPKCPLVHLSLYNRCVKDTIVSEEAPMFRSDEIQPSRLSILFLGPVNCIHWNLIKYELPFVSL